MVKAFPETGNAKTSLSESGQDDQPNVKRWKKTWKIPNFHSFMHSKRYIIHGPKFTVSSECGEKTTLHLELVKPAKDPKKARILLCGKGFEYDFLTRYQIHSKLALCSGDMVSHWDESKVTDSDIDWCIPRNWFFHEIYIPDLFPETLLNKMNDLKVCCDTLIYSGPNVPKWKSKYDGDSAEDAS